MTIRKVKLGSQGAIVSRMGLGCMGVAEIEAAVPENQVAGDRYAAENMKHIDR